MATQTRMKTQLTPQQEKDLEWMSSHRAHIEFRNKILKGLGGFLLWLGIIIGNYFLLSAANITTFAQGIMAVGFEFMLGFLFMYVLFKLVNKKMEFAITSIVFAIYLSLGIPIIFTAASPGTTVAIVFDFAFAFATLLALLFSEDES